MRRSYWLYGLLMGVLLLVLQALQFRTLFYNQRMEIFGGVVAVIFMGVGIWLGISLRQRKSPASAEAAPPTPPAPSTTPEHLGISPRETEVLALLMHGHSNQEIADRLFVSLNTVKTHLANLYQKLDVQRRAQAIHKARELGLVLSGDQPKSPVRVKE